NWAPMPRWSTRPSRWRAIRFAWPSRSRWRLKRAVRRLKSVWPRNSTPQVRRVRSLRSSNENTLPAMKPGFLSPSRVRRILRAAARTRVLVLGDLMLDQFICGRVSRISPEAPVPVVDFERESFMPGGAANVARNLAMLKASVDLLGVIGRDDAGKKLTSLLQEHQVGCDGLLQHFDRATSIKTRVIAHQQQVVRIDRETREELDEMAVGRLLEIIAKKLTSADGVIVGDYGKGVVTQPLLDQIKKLCRLRGIWLSLDPKPAHGLDLANLSLITPN